MLNQIGFEIINNLGSGRICHISTNARALNLMRVGNDRRFSNSAVRDKARAILYKTVGLQIR